MRKMFFSSIIFFFFLINSINCLAIPNEECSKSCLNDGFCLTLNGKSQCYCLPEWDGEHCDIPRPKKTSYRFLENIPSSKRSSRKVPCDYVPTLCKNGGICFLNETVGAAATLDCQCRYPYAGPRCEEYSVCLDYCFNDGVCTVTSGNPICECKQLQTGTRCQSLKTTTTQFPPTTTTDYICVLLGSGYCKSGGTCFVQNGLVMCQCPPTHTGDQCQTPIGGGVTPGPGPGPIPTVPGGSTLSPGGLTFGSCTTNSCSGRGQCFNNGNSYYCYCGSQYNGNNCELFIG